MASNEPAVPVLQIGFGGFGPVHIDAWYRLGYRGRVWVADPDPAARLLAEGQGVPASRIVTDYRDVMERAGLVDVVAPTDRHHAICKDAMTAGKDVFVEKPLTMSLEEAEDLAALVEAQARILQVGFYFRHHPLSELMKDRVTGGDLGELRYVSGQFTGFKRARNDVGVTGNDAVHFIDLFNWLMGTSPSEVFAVRRDHFGRGLDDLALILMTYPDGVLAKIEAGYIQPGHWVDNIVPNALNTKEVQICGAKGAIEIDYQIERLTLYPVRHERQKDGLWWPVFDEVRTPMVKASSPVDVVTAELQCFLDHVEARSRPDADVQRAGVDVARVLEAIERSAIEKRMVSCAA